MTSKVVHIRLKDWALVGCLEFITDKTSVSDAVRRTLETFILVLQKQGRLAEHTPEEVEAILRRNKLLGDESDTTNDPFDFESIIAQTREEPTKSDTPNFAAIGEELEKRIQLSAVPDVREAVTLKEPDTVEEASVFSVNLLHQPRLPLQALKRQAPKDRFIEQATGIMAVPDKVTKDQEIFIAAVEVAYTNLPSDLWGSERAFQEITQLIKLHRED